MFVDDDLIPIRYLNDLLYCERRVALHFIESIWKDNQYTVEGLYSHRNVDVEANLKRSDKRKVTGMWLVSQQLGLIGKADLVEFFEPVVQLAKQSSKIEQLAGEGRQVGNLSYGVPYPVDFKRGKKRRWDNNEVQLCAQALCLEEMLGVPVPRGAIFHIKSGRREEVQFDAALRTKTENAATRLRALRDSRKTPTAKYHAKCKGCSLFEWCMPKALRPRATAIKYLQSLIDDS
jgi:CRISPR-associated exonuclease Cas4